MSEQLHWAQGGKSIYDWPADWPADWHVIINPEMNLIEHFMYKSLLWAAGEQQ